VITAHQSERKLAALLVADVAGYVRLMEADEEAIHHRLVEMRHKIIDPAIAASRGRVVKNTGDGFLAVFDSVLECCRCAVEVQRMIAASEAAQSAATRITFRIGVNFSEVIVEEGDIFGEGVNIAARLQHFAPPGGIAIPLAVRDQIGNRLGLPIIDLGELQLKNVSRPVRAFAVHVQEAAAATVDVALPVGKPSIAVLPFRSPQSEADADYFATGIAEDIVGALSGLQELMVISHGSTIGYRGAGVDPRTVRRDLGVRYVLAGSLRRKPGRLRIFAELSDTETGAVVWTENFDGVAADLFDLQDQIASQIVTTIAPHVREAELKRTLRKRPDSMDAYDHTLQALDLMYRLNLDDFNRARQLLQRAMELDPGYAKAYAMAAKWHGLTFGQGWSSEPDKDAAETDRLATAAILRDSNDALALALCGHHKAFLFRDYDRAISLFDRALAASPNSAMAWTLSSPTYSYIGDGASAIARAERGLRLSPLDPHAFWYQTTLTLAYYAKGDYAAAAEWGSKVAAMKPTFTANLRFLAASLAALGRSGDGQHVADMLMQVEPKFRVGPFATRYAFKDEARRQLFAEHLRLSGLPE
jgi:adenylate cyclase